MAGRGQKAQGQDAYSKLCVPRHRVLSRQTADACERAAETRVRQAGRAACDAGYFDYLDELEDEES